MKLLLLAMSLIVFGAEAVEEATLCENSFSIQLKNETLPYGPGNTFNPKLEKVSVLEIHSSELSEDVADDFFALLNYPEMPSLQPESTNLFPLHLSVGFRKSDGLRGGHPQVVRLTLRGTDQFHFGKGKDSLSGPVARFLFDLLSRHQGVVSISNRISGLRVDQKLVLGKLTCVETKRSDIETYSCSYDNRCQDN